MRPPGAVGRHRAGDAVVERALQLVGDLGLAGHREQLHRELDPGRRDAGLAQPAAVVPELRVAAVAPVLPPGVLAAAHAVDEDFGVAHRLPVEPRGLEAARVAGLAVELERAVEAGGHLIGLAVADVPGRHAGERGVVDVAALGAAAFVDRLREGERLGVAAQARGLHHGPQDGARGQPLVPAEVGQGFSARLHLRGEGQDVPPKRLHRLRVVPDLQAVVRQTDGDVLAAPDVPVLHLLGGGVAGDAPRLVRSPDDVAHRFVERLAQRRAAGGAPGVDGAANDLSPELAAPAPVVLAPAEEWLREVLPADLFEAPLHAQRQPVAQEAAEFHCTGRQRPQNVMLFHFVIVFERRKRPGSCPAASDEGHFPCPGISLSVGNGAILPLSGREFKRKMRTRRGSQRIRVRTSLGRAAWRGSGLDKEPPRTRGGGGGGRGVSLRAGRGQG